MIEEVARSSLAGRTIRSEAGFTAGVVDELYAGWEDEFATYAAVRGPAGPVVVPLDEATLSGSDVVVPYPEDTLRSAPSVEAGAVLSAEQEARVCSHFGLQVRPPDDLNRGITAG